MEFTSGEVAPPSVRVGRNIKAAMVLAGRKQSSLATALGLSQGAISTRLTGKTPIDVNELVTIAEALGTTVSRLLEGVEAGSATEAVSV